MIKKAKIKMIDIELPEELFGDGATVERVAKVKYKKAVKIAFMNPGEDRFNGNLDAYHQELFGELARYFPRWQDVRDVETDEILSNPADDVMVFENLDTNALHWLKQKGLTFDPNQK